MWWEQKCKTRLLLFFLGCSFLRLSFLCLSLLCLFNLPSLLPTLMASSNHLLRLKVRKQIFTDDLNHPAAHEIGYHNGSQTDPELSGSQKGNERRAISELTKPGISTICNHRENSGTKSVAPANATAEAPTRPQYNALFSRIPSRNGRP